jgi:hypothetical protein
MSTTTINHYIQSTTTINNFLIAISYNAYIMLGGLKMRKLFFIIALSLFLLFSISSVSALSTSLVDDSLVVGGSLQEASNANKESYGIYITSAISFNATNDIILLNVVPESPYVQSSSSITNRNLNNINVTVQDQEQSGQDRILTLSARIPEALPAVNTAGEPMPFKVAVLTFSNGSDTVDVDLYMQRKNQLIFSSVDAKYGLEKETRVKDGKRLDGIKPGDSFSFDAEISNSYSRSDDIRIDDITLYFKDSGNYLDVDEEENLGRIDYADYITETVSFSIDQDVDEGTYDLVIRVIGIDNYGARHGEKMAISLRIDRENDEILIQSASIEPSIIDLCDSGYVSISVNVKNTGKKDQRDAAISVLNTVLGYMNSAPSIRLDEGDSVTRNFNVIIPPDSNSGTYKFIIETFYRDNQKSDQKELTLFVKNCNEEQLPPAANQPGKPATDIEVLPQSPTFGAISYAVPVSSSDDDGDKKSISNEGILSPKAIVLIFIALALMVLIVVLTILRK